MKAIFLDRATFSADLALTPPHGLSDYQVYAQTPNDPKIIIERCQDADIVITNKVELTAEIIAQLPKLKLIQLTATGMNNVDKINRGEPPANPDKIIKMQLATDVKEGQ